jgi:Spy/CpxP family protein refolding chaperone
MVARLRAQGLAVLAVAFLGGVLAGAAIEHWRISSRPAEMVETAPVPPEQVIENMKMGGSGIPVLYEALQLTPEQRREIQAIMQANRPRTDSLLHRTWPQLRALLDSVRRQIEQVLTPEQRARLAVMRRGGRG